jgi:PKHD-type hydroxylase
MNNMNENKSNIVDAHAPYGIVWQNFFSREEIIQIFQLANLFPWEKGGTLSGIEDNNTEIEEKVRRSSVKWMYPNDKTKWIYLRIKEKIKEINENHFNFQITGCENIQFSEYSEENLGKYGFHTDMLVHKNGLRKLTISIPLVDVSEYEGGEFLFNLAEDSTFIAKQEVGTAIIFPSWMLHCVNPVRKGKRYSLVTWIYGEMLK